MALYKLQGSLNIIFQLCITIGILIANVVNYLTPKIKGGYGWHVSLGGTAVLALFIVTSSFFLPNTPNSMLEKNEPEKGRAMLNCSLAPTSLCMLKQVSCAINTPWGLAQQDRVPY
ncbi:sugar carrier protein c [Quercus suber]|uniref:Sugar carrier protein c n=1 Tax=Quercus suber TaxID=58331 RepID=A0AAW0L0N3_QUESU